MALSTWTTADTARAEQIWADYQRQQDVSSLHGKTAGIDPRTGRVWIGDSIQDVMSMRDADGCDSLLFFERVGSVTYYRKGAQMLMVGLCRILRQSGHDIGMSPSCPSGGQKNSLSAKPAFSQ